MFVCLTSPLHFLVTVKPQSSGLSLPLLGPCALAGVRLSQVGVVCEWAKPALKIQFPWPYGSWLQDGASGLMCAERHELGFLWEGKTSSVGGVDLFLDYEDGGSLEELLAEKRSVTMRWESFRSKRK